MREVKIEDYLVSEVAKRDGVAEKWGTNGRPDRMVFLPGGRFGLAEVKRPGKDLEPLQRYLLGLYARLGVPVACLASFADVDRFLQELAHA